MKILIIFIILGYCIEVSASPLDNPRISLNDITGNYQGSFKIKFSDPENPYATLAYQQGKMAINSSNNSIFVDSIDVDDKGDMIAEFKIPNALGTSSNPDELPNATLLQPFVKILNRTDTANTDGLDNLYGMSIINGQLFIQAARWYDGDADNTDTTLIVRTPSNLATSNVDGFFKMTGGARTVNYISPIPAEWQSILGGTHIAGNGNGMSISSRLSIGPSLYVFNYTDFSSVSSGSISATAKLNFTVATALSSTVFPYANGDFPPNWDAYNNTGISSNFAKSNTMWTLTSSAWFAFIVPGTRTFAVFGESGMHDSGGGYKITQDDGNVCGGPCPYNHMDHYAYYWLFDLKDIIGATNTYSITPYEYGKFNSRYGGLPSSGGFDPTTGKFYLYLRSANKTDPRDRSGYPVINVYKLPVPAEQRSSPSINKIYFN